MKNFLRSTWISFLSLKKWQKVLIISVLVILGLSSISSENTKSVSNPTPVSTPSPVVTPSETPEITPTPSASPTPESPIEFRFAVLRDADDMNKDVEDALKGISKDGLGKYSWNVLEITFNMQQLKMRVPQPEYEEKWNQILAQLETSVTQLEEATASDSLTITLAKKKLRDVQAKIPPLKSFAKTLAN